MKRWDKEEVFHDGDLFFSRLQDAIDAAQKTIDFECYIFLHDQLGRRILHHLKMAAQRGVQVRLLLDGIGSSQWSHRLLAEIQRDGLLVQIYHPLPWISLRRLTLLRLFRSFRFRNFIKSIWKINRRNHRKVCIIDSKQALLGGMNVSARHLREFHSNEAWRDTSVCLEGSEISRLEEAFQHAWMDHLRINKKDRSKSNHFTLKNSDQTLVKLNDSRRKRRAYRQELIHRILKSQQRVWITTPYFVPDSSFIRALRYAAWSGVDIKILLPKKNDIFFMNWANQASYSLLLKFGIRIFEYLPSTLHAKVVLIDDWITVGSSNRNHRSLIHDLEVDIVLRHEKSINSIENKFLEDISQSEEITIPAWTRQSKLKLFFERLILFFRYWV